jgi:hypothetical protein
MPTYRRKPPEFEGYQFSGDDQAPGWPAGWNTAHCEYSGADMEKALALSGIAKDIPYSHVVNKGDFVFRHPKSGEFFSLPGAYFVANFEESR